VLVFTDPYGFYTLAQWARVYNASSASGFFPVVPGAYGRNGRIALRLASGATYIGRSGFSPGNATGIFEIDFKIQDAPVSASPLLSLVDGSTVQVALEINASRQFEVYRNSGGSKVLLATLTTYTVPLNTHIHVGFKAAIDNSGSFSLQVWEDGAITPTATLTGSGDTQASASAQWNAFRLGKVGTTTDFSNFVLMDGSGARLNDFLGPVDVYHRIGDPSQAASLNDWSPSTGTNRQALIDDTTPNDDADYVFETGAGRYQSTYVKPVQDPDREILGLGLFLAVKKPGSGSPTIAPVVRQGSTNTVGASRAPDATYTYQFEPYSQMPDGSVMSAAAVDALQWGIKVS
jgi:hypothetical protein